MHAYWLVFIFLFGACIGSFLNVAIYRLPRGESIVFPGSRCPACGRGIRWYDNIPLISWFALGGKCRHCRAPISPRYVLIEAATALLVAGLYACYYILRLRRDVGTFEESWPMFLAHAGLLCGLLACTAVDLELWIIPLEVMWFCALLGVAAAAFRPHPFLPAVSPAMIACCVMAVIGLGISCLLLRYNILQPSFLGAEEPAPPPEPGHAKSKKDGGKAKPIRAVAITAAHGVNPRVEILREVLFLLPAILLAAGAAVSLRYLPAVANAWSRLFDTQCHPHLAGHLQAAGSAVVGYVVGGLWIWGIRILGTLAFGREAMGLGDAHIMAAVGAVTGWIVPSVAFFVAPFLGLLWAVYLWLRRSQRELPYGPWLAAATVLVMIFYDTVARFLHSYASALQLVTGNGVTR